MVSDRKLSKLQREEGRGPYQTLEDLATSLAQAYVLSMAQVVQSTLFVQELPLQLSLAFVVGSVEICHKTSVAAGNALAAMTPAV